MVEVTPLDPSSFLSNSDKHRGTRFPQTIDDDVCLETGIDLGDGTHILFKPGMRHSSYTYSISNATRTNGSGRDSFCILYYRNFMELVPRSVNPLLEGTASACT